MSGWCHFVRLLEYARPYKRYVGLQGLLMLVSIVFGLLKPWPLKILVDNVVNEQPLLVGGWNVALGPLALLALACVAYLVFHAGESLIQLGSTSVATFTSSRMIRDLRSDLLKKLHKLSLRFHDRHRVGDLVHRVSFNATSVETAFQSGFMGVVKSTLMLVCMFGVMVAMSPLLTGVALLIVPLLLLVIRLYARRIQKISWKHQEQEGAVSSRLQEVLSSIRLVQAFNAHQREQQQFDQLADRSVGTRLRSTVLQQSFGLLTTLVLALGTVLMFWVGIQQVRAGELTLGQFLVFNAYLAMLYAPLSVLSYMSSSVQSALGSGTRLFEILEADDELEEDPAAVALQNVQGGFTVENVVFSYQENKPVLQDVSLAVRPGEYLAIVGETGGGKSTLLNLLLRFYDPNQGRILFDGTDLRQIRLDALRETISFVAQDTILLSTSIGENIAYGRPQASAEEIVEAARQAGADGFIREFPDGYDTAVGERGVYLSTGQRQRIALARAFLKNANVMILDEPTSALDAGTEAQLMQHIAAFARTRTVIIVAHRLSTIRDADRIVVLSQGRICDSGSHDELMEHNGIYARLWNAQATGRIARLG